MKLIEACVRPELVDRIISAVEKVGVSCLSAIDVKTIGEETKGENEQFSVEYGTSYAKRSKIKIFCDENKASRVFDIIKREAYTGHKGDGFISQMSLDKFEKVLGRKIK